LDGGVLDAVHVRSADVVNIFTAVVFPGATQVGGVHIKVNPAAG
jgi:hypothetical protein